MTMLNVRDSAMSLRLTTSVEPETHCHIRSRIPVSSPITEHRMLAAFHRRLPQHRSAITHALDGYKLDRLALELERLKRTAASHGYHNLARQAGGVLREQVRGASWSIDPPRRRYKRIRGSVRALLGDCVNATVLYHTNNENKFRAAA